MEEIRLIVNMIIDEIARLATIAGETDTALDDHDDRFTHLEARINDLAERVDYFETAARVGVWS